MDALKLFDDYQNCEGYKIKLKINNVEMSFNIFRDNFASMKDVVDKFSDPGFSITFKGEDFPKYFREINKELHNFLASVKTLVDHTRTMVEDLYPKESEIRKDYDQKILDLRKKDVCSFVQELRNYALHKKIPISVAQISYDQENGYKSCIKLDIGKLLSTYSKWNATLKTYLENLNTEICLSDILEEYYKNIIELYDWLYQEQIKFHKKDFDEMKSYEGEIKRIQNDMDQIEKFYFKEDKA